MVDHVVVILAINVFGLFGIDYYDLHGFGLESYLSIVLGLIVIYLKHKGEKK